MEKIESLLDSAGQTTLTIGVTLLFLHYRGDAAGNIKIPDAWDITVFFIVSVACAFMSGVFAGMRKSKS